jgi:hypothetical protein
MKIIPLDKTPFEVTVLDEATKNRLLHDLNGKQDNSLRKKWTARTFVLSDGKILIEFYDRQAAVIDNLSNFKKLEGVRFVKNTIDFLKKNISYKIELSYEEGNHIIQEEEPKRLTNLKSDMPEYYNFEVYELSTGQILSLNKSENLKSAIIYPDLKTLSSDNNAVAELVYGYEDEEQLMNRLAAGDALLDYEPNDHLIYPKYEKDLIKNHKLSLIESKVFVDFSSFYGNLYKSENGYYILLDDFNQLNVPKTGKLGIGALRVYEKLEDVKAAQKKYEEFKRKKVVSEHFYKKLSDRYGRNFPEHVPRLIDSLPTLLNFDKDQISFDSTGIDLIDEALKWNGTNYKLFDAWFPSVLAFYGQSYIKSKQDGKWTMYFDKEYKVWIPELKLKDGSAAWDWRDFYKDLYEGPIPLRWTGDWDGTRRKIRSSIKNANSQ